MLILWVDSLEKTLMLGGMAGGEGDSRGWNGWMASPTQWTWVWASFRSWWWTGKPGMLQSMRSQRVWLRYDWATELNWTVQFSRYHLLRKLHTVLHDGYTNLHLHQQCGMMPFIHIFTNTSVQFSSSLSRVRLFATPWTAARQASLSISDSWNLLKLMSIESVMPSNHLILCHPFLLLPSIFPSIRLFFQWVSSLHQTVGI